MKPAEQDHQRYRLQLELAGIRAQIGRVYRWVEESAWLGDIVRLATMPDAARLPERLTAWLEDCRDLRRKLAAYHRRRRAAPPRLDDPGAAPAPPPLPANATTEN